MSRDIEKPFRDALGHAIRNEIDEMEQGLLRLTNEQIEACLGLCAYVSGYIAIDVCGRQWPDEDNLRGIGESAAERPKVEAYSFTKEDAYAYIKRVALRNEPMNEVLSPPERAGTLSFVITGELLLTFHMDGEKWWDYLTRIEEAWEIGQAMDLDLLPTLMWRAWRSPDPRRPQSSSEGTGAGSS